MIITIEGIMIVLSIITILNSLAIIYACKDEIKNAFCTKGE